jgi:hypothetical protein
VTDSSDPTSRSSRRQDASREPPTIDLKARVVDDGARDPDTPASEPSEPAHALAEDTSRTEVTPDAPVSDADMASASEARGSAPEDDRVSPSLGSAQSDPEPPTRRSSGFGALAAAGLLGGLVGAGLVWALQTLSPAATRDDPRLSQIEQSLGAMPRADAVQRLEARIGAVEGQQGQVAQRLQAAQTLAERAASRAEEAANRPAPATPASPQNNQALADLGNRVGALETQWRERNQTAAAAAQSAAAAITDLGNRLGALETQMRERAQAASTAAQASTTAIQGMERRLAEQEQRLGGLSRQVAEGGSEATRAGTRVVLADRLNDALRDGAPYAEVLAGLSRFNVDPARIEPLQPFASQGAPTASALAQSFRPVSEQILRSSRPVSEGWTDRLTRMAERVVTVRSLGEPQSQGVAGLVDRIEASLARGAFADAAAAWDALPEPARRQSEDWGRQLKQRAAADAAARAIAADAVAALNPTTR